MSLDIGIGDGRSLWPIESEPSVVLEDDGYYWFLHPSFAELHDETGQYIDLYGEATFQGEQLRALEQVFFSARDLVEIQPATWQVHAGTLLTPEPRERLEVVQRSCFLELLSRLGEVVSRAKELGQPVVCFGD